MALTPIDGDSASLDPVDDCGCCCACTFNPWGRPNVITLEFAKFDVSINDLDNLELIPDGIDPESWVAIAEATLTTTEGDENECYYERTWLATQVQEVAQNTPPELASTTPPTPSLIWRYVFSDTFPRAANGTEEFIYDDVTDFVYNPGWHEAKAEYVDLVINALGTPLNKFDSPLISSTIYGPWLADGTVPCPGYLAGFSKQVIRRYVVDPGSSSGRFLDNAAIDDGAGGYVEAGPPSETETWDVVFRIRAGTRTTTEESPACKKCLLPTSETLQPQLTATQTPARDDATVPADWQTATFLMNPDSEWPRVTGPEPSAIAPYAGMVPWRSSTWRRLMGLRPVKYTAGNPEAGPTRSWTAVGGFQLTCSVYSTNVSGSTEYSNSRGIGGGAEVGPRLTTRQESSGGGLIAADDFVADTLVTTEPWEATFRDSVRTWFMQKIIPSVANTKYHVINSGTVSLPLYPTSVFTSPESLVPVGWKTEAVAGYNGIGTYVDTTKRAAILTATQAQFLANGGTGPDANGRGATGYFYTKYYDADDHTGGVFTWLDAGSATLMTTNVKSVTIEQVGTGKIVKYEWVSALTNTTAIFREWTHTFSVTQNDFAYGDQKLDQYELTLELYGIGNYQVYNSLVKLQHLTGADFSNSTTGFVSGAARFIWRMWPYAYNFIRLRINPLTGSTYAEEDGFHLGNY